MLKRRIEQFCCYLFVDVFAIDLLDIHTEWKIVNSILRDPSAVRGSS